MNVVHMYMQHMKQGRGVWMRAQGVDDKREFSTAAGIEQGYVVTPSDSYALTIEFVCTSCKDACLGEGYGCSLLKGDSPAIWPLTNHLSRQKSSDIGTRTGRE